eukprot:sb/3475038/
MFACYVFFARNASHDFLKCLKEKFDETKFCPLFFSAFLRPQKRSDLCTRRYPYLIAILPSKQITGISELSWLHRNQYKSRLSRPTRSASRKSLPNSSVQALQPVSLRQSPYPWTALRSSFRWKEVRSSAL